MRGLAFGLIASVGTLTVAGCAGADAPAPAPTLAGSTTLHLIFTGNVHGEIEPCG